MTRSFLSVFTAGLFRRDALCCLVYKPTFLIAAID